MFRNLVAILLVLNILWNNYKLNYTECVLFYTICIFFILGNFGFYFLEKYPENIIWNFFIKGGYHWYEFPVTMILMVFLLFYKFIF